MKLKKSLILLIAAVLLAAMCFAGAASAAPTTDGGIAWEVVGTELKITIPATPETGYDPGEMKDYGYGQAPWYSYADELTTVKLPDGLKYIGEYAFTNCTALTGVTIPSSVTDIGRNAFGECSGLTSLGLNEGLKNISIGAFAYCSGLTTVTIPASVKRLGVYSGGVDIPASVFMACTKLKEIKVDAGNQDFESVDGVLFSKNITPRYLYCYPNGKKDTKYTVPNDVEKIHSLAFSGNSALTEITIHANVTRLDHNAFVECIGLKKVTFAPGSKLETIELSAFSMCTNLTGIEIPANVTAIKDNAFRWCVGLTSIEIPANVTSIGDRAFAQCTGMTSVTFAPDAKLKKIGSFAFMGCGITGIEIPASVTDIDTGVFYKCTDLSAISVAKGNTVFSVTDGILFNTSNTSLLCYPAGKKNLRTYTVPDGLETIEKAAFAYNSRLTGVSIPDSVKNLDERAFESCTQLSSVTLPKDLKILEGSVFNRCTALESIDIPDSVEVIKTTAFYLSGLTSVTLPVNLKTIEDGAFGRCNYLQSVTIPQNISDVGALSFEACFNLTCVNYTDTAAQPSAQLFAALPNAVWYLPGMGQRVNDLPAANYVAVLNGAQLPADYVQKKDTNGNYILPAELQNASKDENYLVWHADEECTGPAISILNAAQKHAFGKWYPPYNITNLASKHGSISVRSPAEGKYNSKVTVITNPDNGYRFKSLTVENTTLGETIATEGKTFIMPNFDVNVTATFEKIFTSSSSGSNGGATVILTETPTTAPTAEPTPVATIQPVGNSTLKPTTKPATSKSPAPFVGLVAGLGAALLIRIRR